MMAEKELGVERAGADFKQPAAALSDDELGAVAGGGYSKTGSERCVCGFAGYGYDT